MARIRVKPSKGQSTAGFVMGLVFIGIGLFVAIPAMGGFGIIWTLFALIITIINGLNAFTDKGVASHVINADIEVLGDKKYDFAEKLRELESLREDGLISYDEYNKKRQEILNKKW